MRRLIRAILKNPRAHRYLRGLYAEEANRRGAPAQTAGVETSIGELFPLPPRASALDTGTRINLLVPALSIRHVFGGINTALVLFEGIIDAHPNARIILTDEQTFESADNPAYSDWKIASLDEDDQPGRLIVPAGDRYGKSLAVAPGDYFVATAWWTAALARKLIDWQHKTLKIAEPRRFAYLIQDFEPGFYPWSSRYALADATYRAPDRVIPIFNTSLLASFFEKEGYEFNDPLAFEPGLHPELREGLLHNQKSGQAERERTILVYGRPKTARNAFALIVQGLMHWIEQGNGADWQFLSVGEEHPDIDLGHGRQLKSLGKLSIGQYADRLSSASIGISLMISPHPSYPPMEMAAFGMHVITNQYRHKDLSQWFKGVASLPATDPEHIAAALTRLSQLAPPGPTAPTGPFAGYLQGGDDIRALGAVVRQRLVPGPASGNPNHRIEQ